MSAEALVKTPIMTVQAGECQHSELASTSGCFNGELAFLPLGVKLQNHMLERVVLLTRQLNSHFPSIVWLL